MSLYKQLYFTGCGLVTWIVTTKNMSRLERKEANMFRWLFIVNVHSFQSKSVLWTILSPRSIRRGVQERRLRGYRQVMIRNDQAARFLKTHYTLTLEETCGRRRPRKILGEVAKHDPRILSLTEASRGIYIYIYDDRPRFRRTTNSKEVVVAWLALKNQLLLFCVAGVRSIEPQNSRLISSQFKCSTHATMEVIVKLWWLWWWLLCRLWYVYTYVYIYVCVHVCTNIYIYLGIYCRGVMHNVLLKDDSVRVYTF